MSALARQVDDIAWHDEAELMGLRVRAWFFDPQAPLPAHLRPVAGQQAAEVARSRRLLPLLADLGLPTLGSGTGQRQAYRAGALQAQPELVLVHGNGLVCLANRPLEDGRWHQPMAWTRQLTLEAMLHAVAAAMAVSGHTQRPTAALWRGPNVVYQFDPGAQVLECLATHIGAALHYWGEPQVVTPAQLASFCEPRLRAMPGLTHGDTLGAAP